MSKTTADAQQAVAAIAQMIPNGSEEEDFPGY